jgi:hypothetical protein
MSSDEDNERKFEKGKYLSFNEIKKYFDIPIIQAAKELNVSETCLKKICRLHNIRRWPFRRLSSLKHKLELLNSQPKSEFIARKIDTIQNEMEYIHTTGTSWEDNPSVKKNRIGKKKNRNTLRTAAIAQNVGTIAVPKEKEDTPCFYIEAKSTSISPKTPPLGFHLNLDVSELTSELNNGPQLTHIYDGSDISIVQK